MADRRIRYALGKISPRTSHALRWAWFAMAAFLVFEVVFLAAIERERRVQAGVDMEKPYRIGYQDGSTHLTETPVRADIRDDDYGSN